MKKIILLLALAVFGAHNLDAQTKMSTKAGTIQFEASVPSFEEVKAKNENVSAILKTETGEFAALALVKGFRFKVALMEEHFNENYMESSQFPKAVVKGKLEGFSADGISNDGSEYLLKGTITVHGVTKPLETKVMMKQTSGGVELQANFALKPGDFNIEIPSIVSSKIAEDIDVSVTFQLK